jgi:3-deoxy-D-manno-octulosonic-acid transferase
MKPLYHLFLLLYPFAARCIAPFNKKAQLWVNGRKNWKKQLKQILEEQTKPAIWMHCSSLGEFEQGLPLFEALKSTYPNHFFVVSFFSPSGYEIIKNHPVANYVCYLPMDSPKNAKEFIELVNPKMALFIKYEFWYYYLRQLHQKGIPTLLVSAIFRKDQLFFKWYGQFYKNMLQFFNHIFLQDDTSKELLSSIGFNQNIHVSGDTRFDRVISIANAHTINDTIVRFCNNQNTIIAGSTWGEDDKCLHHYAIANPSIQFIIAPHDIEQERIEECLQFYPNAIAYSKYQAAIANNLQITNYQTLVIDNMGMLSSLYRYATIAFIGGGFIEEGVHNTLEAAVYGVPILFGATYNKYLEAVQLVEKEGAFAVADLIELEQVLNELMSDEQIRKRVGANAKDYVYAKSGATKKIMLVIQEKRLLTN